MHLGAWSVATGLDVPRTSNVMQGYAFSQMYVAIMSSSPAKTAMMGILNQGMGAMAFVSPKSAATPFWIPMKTATVGQEKLLRGMLHAEGDRTRNAAATAAMTAGSTVETG